MSSVPQILGSDLAAVLYQGLGSDRSDVMLLSEEGAEVGPAGLGEELRNRGSGASMGSAVSRRWTT